MSATWFDKLKNRYMDVINFGRAWGGLGCALEGLNLLEER